MQLRVVWQVLRENSQVDQLEPVGSRDLVQKLVLFVSSTL